MNSTQDDESLIDSRQAALRLLVTLGLVVLGNSSMYVISVVLPTVQGEFGIGRADASLPYTIMMVCLGIGGVWTGRLADRHGLSPVLWCGALAVFGGFAMASYAQNVWWFGLAHAILGLIGSSSTFAPLMADTALWWRKRRGIAVAICACGNYIAGAIWPPLVQHGIASMGWRETYLLLGLFCGVGMFLLSLKMRAKPPVSNTISPNAQGASMSGSPHLDSALPFGMQASKAQWLLCIAGLACCVAMAMPQVHIVAYCTDLGYGATRGAQMLSLMLTCGIVSRLVSGLICDRIGGIRTLLLGSFLQGIALLAFLPFDGMVSLYVISATFGLFQGGIVPSYAIIVREHFSPQEVGERVGSVIMATLLGMALGGWMSGWIFDLTGNYKAAFLNGMVWNLLNFTITLWLYLRSRSK